MTKISTWQPIRQAALLDLAARLSSPKGLGFKGLGFRLSGLGFRDPSLNPKP